MRERGEEGATQGKGGWDKQKNNKDTKDGNIRQILKPGPNSKKKKSQNVTTNATHLTFV